MNLLIVDDEFYNVENIKNKLAWHTFGFEQVLCAYSVEQAKEVFSHHIIDVLLCDIEMPKASGLDLLAWIRQQNLQTECIFLTCFAEFSYANRALQLNSSDYLLKPVDDAELLRAVQKAISLRRRKEAEKTNELYAEYWANSDVQRKEQFWLHVIQSSDTWETERIAKELSALHLPRNLMQQSYLPLLIKYRYIDDGAGWDKSTFAYALKNMVCEIFSGEEMQKTITCIKTDHRQLFLPLPCAPQDKPALLAQCATAMKTCCRVLPAAFRFYVAGPCEIDAVAQLYQTLRCYAYNDVSQNSDVFDITAQAQTDADIQPLPAPQWTERLLRRDTDAVRREAVSYLENIAHKRNASRQEFLAFYHDFSQILYAVLDKKGAEAHRLFAGGQSANSEEQACDSLASLSKWVTDILVAYTELVAQAEKTGSVIDDAKNYVRDHLAEDLNRNDIAQAVYLSPDYLSHLFREKTGTSLTSFIASERIQYAKELLLDNTVSVRDIALASGFQNISYFSKQFKRATGQTPQDFRKGELS